MDAEQHGSYLPTVRIGSKTKDTKMTGYNGTIFLSERMESWDKWFDTMQPLLELDPMNEANHIRIAEAYQVRPVYEELVVGNTTERTKFLALVDAVQEKKAERSKMKRMGSDLIMPNGCITMIEGNNRRTHIENIMHLSKYDVENGTVHPGSLLKDNLADSLGSDVGEKKAIADTLAGQDGTLESWINKAMEDLASIYRTQIVVRFFHGVPEKEFKAKNITMDAVGRACRNLSRTISRDKRDSANLADTNRLAAIMNNYIDQLQDSDDKISGGFIPTFTRNAGEDAYVENDAARPPGDECSAFATETFKALIKDPNPTTLAQAVGGQPVALMTRAFGTLRGFKVVPEQYGFGPFWYDDEALVNVIGKLLTKDTKSPNKSGSKTVMPKNKPLGVEEWNMALMLCMIFPTVYRMHHCITYEDWKNHNGKEACENELKFILRTQIFTSEANTWGKELNKNEREYDEWKWASTEHPNKPERVYWAAAMMISGMMVSMMYLDIKEPPKHPDYQSVKNKEVRMSYEKAVIRTQQVKAKNLKKINGLINAFESYQNDRGGVGMQEGGRHIVYILGTYIQTILYYVSC